MLCRLLVAIVVLSSTGCATLGTKLGVKPSFIGVPYSGTEVDLWKTRCGAIWIDQGRYRSGTEALLSGIIDLPFSFTADTILLPIDIPYEGQRDSSWDMLSDDCKLLHF